MPSTLFDRCDSDEARWTDLIRRGDKSHDSIWDHSGKAPPPAPTVSACADWPRLVGYAYDSRRRVTRAFLWHDQKRIARRTALAQNNHLQEQFEKLASQWRRETRFSSSIDEKILHPAYQSIIAMGTPVVPLVLSELQRQRGHWFWALHFVTGADPVPQGANVEEARQAWLQWGRQKGLLK